VAEVLIEGRRLDVKEGLDFSFNYSIADIRDPNKRKTNFSKTIQCPATKSNDVLFGQIWDVNISNSYNPSDTNVEVNFNPNKKASARVIHDGVTVMDGVVQLRAITINNGRYDYEVVFIGNLKTIFSEIANKELNGLDENGFPYIDFSDLDHQYDYGRITSSWNNTSGYVYPMIDYGVNEPFQLNGVDSWRVEQFRPAVFLKDIIDRIFDYAGFTYTSTFFDSTFFGNLIVPWTNEGFVVSESEIAIRETTASVQTPIDVNVEFFPNYPIFGNTIYNWRIDFDQLVDPNNNWSNANDEYTVPENGFYSFATQLTYISERVSITGVPVPSPNPINVLFAYVRFRRLSVSSGQDTIISEQLVDFRGSGTPLIGETFSETVALSCPSIQLDEGDTVYMEVLGLSGGLTGLVNFEIDITAGTFQSQVSNETIVQGQTIPMNALTPSVEMEELLISVFKMFNLLVEIDKTNDTNLLIETRDTFYANGEIKDWTNKLARDRKIQLKPTASISDKLYRYTYTEDDDYDNQKYQGKYQRVYGDARVEVDNDFVNSENDVEVVFSPTVLVNDRNSNRIVGRIYAEDVEDGIEQTDHNIRILYWGGLIPSQPQWNFRYIQEGLGAVDVLQHFYPYAGHWNNPITPTTDINFGLIKELRYTANGYTGTLQVTNANLFNVYHRAEFLEKTDKDAKIMEGHFYLDAFDIEKLDFRDQILIDNTYWRLNKVNDYNPFKDGLTKVELFKVLDIIPQEVETSIVGQNNTINDSNEEVRVPFGKSLKRSSNVYPDFVGDVRGSNNRVGYGSADFKIVGDENQVGEKTKNITILGNNNTVLAGLENVVIINSDNQEVTESNTTIIDGKKQWSTVETDVDYSASDRDFVLADSSKSAPPVTITLPTLSEGLWVCVKKTDATASNVDITSGVSGTIDGSGTYSLTTQYDSVELFCDGSNWYIRSDK